MPFLDLCSTHPCKCSEIEKRYNTTYSTEKDRSSVLVVYGIYNKDNQEVAAFGHKLNNITRI
jgi:hypothetical protein